MIHEAARLISRLKNGTRSARLVALADAVAAVAQARADGTEPHLEGDAYLYAADLDAGEEALFMGQARLVVERNWALILHVAGLLERGPVDIADVVERYERTTPSVRRALTHRRAGTLA